MDGMELYQELDKVLKQHQWCLKELRNSGSEFAEAERRYNTLKRKHILALRAQGEAVGIIDKIYKGIPEVADALFDMRVKEQLYKANQEAVMSTKLQIKIINENINRAYSSPSAGVG